MSARRDGDGMEGEGRDGGETGRGVEKRGIAS